MTKGLDIKAKKVKSRIIRNKSGKYLNEQIVESIVETKPYRDLQDCEKKVDMMMLRKRAEAHDLLRAPGYLQKRLEIKVI